MEVFQCAVAAAANVVAPGAGTIVNIAFDLGKIAFDVALALQGMEARAATFKLQRATIETDVRRFSTVLAILKQFKYPEALVDEMRHSILHYHDCTLHYSSALARHEGKSRVLQVLFSQELINASAATNKATDILQAQLTMALGVSMVNRQLDAATLPVAFPTGGASIQQQQRIAFEHDRQLRLEYVDSPAFAAEAADTDISREALAAIVRSNAQAKAPDPASGCEVPVGSDPAHIIKQKLWASSSADVQEEVRALPEWYVTGMEIERVGTRPIAFGGDAKIFEGKQHPQGQAVALKYFKFNVNASAKLKKQFVDRMNLWSRLTSPQLCRLHGACHLAKKPFVVMELCAHGALDTFLRRDEANRRARAVRLLYEASQGLLYMHSSGIVHGDVKCDNILVTGSGHVRLADFDRSFDWTAIQDRGLADGAASAAGIEITGATRWLAPECVNGMVPSRSSDVYSFGMTMYQALSGCAPYHDVDDENAVKQHILQSTLPLCPPSLIGDEISILIQSMCQLDPEKRPNMHIVVKTLQTLRKSYPRMRPLAVKPIVPSTLSLPPPSPTKGRVGGGRRPKEKDRHNRGSPSKRKPQKEHAAPSVAVKQSPKRHEPAAAAVNGGGYNLGPIFDEITKAMQAMEERATRSKNSERVKTDIANIREVLTMLEHLKGADGVGATTQTMIHEFHSRVLGYRAVKEKHDRKNPLRKMLSRKDVSEASQRAGETTEQLKQNLQTVFDSSRRNEPARSRGRA